MNIEFSKKISPSPQRDIEEFKTPEKRPQSPDLNPIELIW